MARRKSLCRPTPPSCGSFRATWMTSGLAHKSSLSPGKKFRMERSRRQRSMSAATGSHLRCELSTMRLASGDCACAIDGDSFLLCVSTGDPLRQGFPVRVVLRGKLPTAGVEGVAARLRREWLQEQPTVRGIAQHYQRRDDVKVLARLFLSPESCSRWQFLEPKGVVAFLVANVAAGVALSFLQEDWLDF